LRICFKMSGEIHPHTLIGNFCKAYEQRFRKAVETGEYSLETEIDLQNFKIQATPGVLSQGNSNAGALFYKVLGYLGHLIQNTDDNSRKRIVNIDISKIETILQGDAIFDKARRVEVA